MKTAAELRSFAMAMKKRPTLPEVLFEQRLQTTGIQYKRQMILGFYILDFVLPDLLLNVELDGCQHSDGADNLRDSFVKKCGLEVLRIPNEQAATFPIERLVNRLAVAEASFKRVLARANGFRRVALIDNPKSLTVR